MAAAAARCQEEEGEEHHRNPFLSTISNKQFSSKIQLRKVVSIARWDEELKMGEVVEKKGCMWTSTGITRNGKLYCHIEAILFLAERGALLLSDCEETTLSMKNIYQKIASGVAGCLWESFEVYRNLKSLGYIVGRHGTPWTMKNNISCQEVEEEISTTLEDMKIANLNLDFDVYLPNSKFRKSSPGNPSFVLSVVRESPPSRVEAEKLEGKCNGIPLKFCFVDHGRVSFFSFDRVVLPNLP